MKNKLFGILIIVLVFFSVFGIIAYNKHKKSLTYSVEKIDNEKYFLLMQNKKFGVIDDKGNVIIDPLYDIVEIPNPSKALFICKNNYDSKTKKYNVEIYDDSKNRLLYQYYIVEAIGLNNVENNGYYEKSILKYQSNNKYGLIDFNGNKITDAIYDSIEGFPYREGLLLVKKSEKYGVINMNGATIIKEKYDEILSDAYYDDTNGYNLSGYIVGNKTNNGMRYGYIDYNRKEILKNEFNEIYRITEKHSNDDIYIVAFKDGRAGLYNGKKQIIGHNYEDISYVYQADLLMLQKANKKGISRFDGSQVIPIEYDNVFLDGEYINAQKNGVTDIYELNGNVLKNSEYIGKQKVADGKYEIVTTSDDEYKIINGSSIIENSYAYIQYIYKDYFYAIKDKKSGLIDAKGNVLIDFKYNVVQRINGTDIIRLMDIFGNTILLNSDLERIAELKDTSIFVYGKYVKIRTGNDIKYLDKDGNEISNLKVFENNDILAYRENEKWGFKSRNGEIIVPAKYDIVTEFNKYGYAGVKDNNRWGAVDKSGEEVAMTKYKFDGFSEPSFIKDYYRVDSGYDIPYYTNEQ